MAKSESISLGLTAAASAADAPVQKKIFKSVWKTNILIFLNKEKEISQKIFENSNYQKNISCRSLTFLKS